MYCSFCSNQKSSCSQEIARGFPSLYIFLQVDLKLNRIFLDWIIEQVNFYNLLFNGPKRAAAGRAGPRLFRGRAGPGRDEKFRPLDISNRDILNREITPPKL